MATWYVAPSTVTTTGAGTRDQPFKANEINWTPIEGGDIIYLRSALGPYNETLTIGKSGIAGNYITIDSDPIDSGKALIDGQLTRLEGITQSSKSYIWIKNIEIKNTFGENNRAILPGDNWKINGVEIHNCFYGIAFSSVINPYLESSVFNECNFPISVYNASNSAILKNIRSVVTSNIPGSLVVGGLNSILLSFDDIILDGGNTGATNTGVLGIYDLSFMDGSIIKNTVVKNSTMVGCQFRGCNNLEVRNLKASNNLISGVYVGAGAYNINFVECDFSYNRDDGIDFIDDAHDINMMSCTANKNGYPIPYDSINSGDGFSAHGTCYNINHYFCVANGNRNSGFAHVNTSAGEIVNCTVAFNGDEAGVTVRAGIFINTNGDNPVASTGSKSWKIKNCIGYKNYPRELALTPHSKTAIEADYNSYKPLNDAIFATYDWGVTFTDVSWATYHATYEANSKNEDSKVTTSGIIPYSSPCVDTAPWITGVNDGGQIDPWGKKVYGLPNIGADQGAGMPITGIRVSGFSKHFR